MRHTTISGHRGRHHAVAAVFWLLAAFWTVAGIVAVIGLGGGFTRLAVVLAIVTTEWWLISEVEDRFDRNAVRSDAKVAALTHLRPAPVARKIEISPPRHGLTAAR
jgi:hypothetical protein